MPGAKLETISPDARFITFPVTDGDDSRRPDNTQPPPTSAREVNWHRKMTMEEKYVCRWRNLIGQGIAKLMDKPDKDKHCLQSFPGGYLMFDHNKGPISNPRHDLYLYGSKNVLRFRSPAEFIPHGYWLLTDPTLNVQNCGCKYCGGGGKKTQTEISESLGLPTTRGGRLSRSSGAAAANGTWVAREVRQQHEVDPAWKTSSLNLNLAANIMRVSDLMSGRRFRIGELVWCAWDHNAPDPAGVNRSGHKPRLWPALVVDYSLEASVEHCSPLSAPTYSVLQARRYTVLRLGAPSFEARMEYECMMGEDEVLPWHAHQMDPAPLSSSESGNNVQSGGSLNSFALALRTAHNLVNFWAVYDGVPIKVPAPSSHIVPIQSKYDDSRSVASGAFTPFPQPSLSSRSTPPSSIPYPIDTTPQRSPARLVPPSSTARNRFSNVSAAHMPTSQPPTTLSEAAPSQRIQESWTPQPKSATVTETHYQGLWYGAEKIWTGDVVRLCPEREAFAVSLRLSSRTQRDESWRQRIAPSPGANMRAVLMRVDRIFARIGEDGMKECAVAGPLYELSPKDWSDARVLPTDLTALDLSRSSSGAPSRSVEPSYPWDMTETTPPPRDKVKSECEDIVDVLPSRIPLAPPGYALRPLLSPGTEIPLPLSFVAGRYYADALQWPALASVVPRIPRESEITTLSQLASADSCSTRLLSLCALAPGRFNHSVCVDVRLANRVGMLEEAVSMSQAKRRAVEVT